jgi:repressor LexA
VRGATDDYFGLAVVGDSMDQEGIKEGDIVIIRKQPDVENGQIAAVIIDEEVATIKKFYRNGKYISLNPSSSNPDHQPRIIDPEITPVRILGRVIKAVINI